MENFEKYHGAFCSFIRGGGEWVVNLKNFEKSAYVPSKSTCTPRRTSRIPDFRVSRRSWVGKFSPYHGKRVNMLVQWISSLS